MPSTLTSRALLAGVASGLALTVAACGAPASTPSASVAPSGSLAPSAGSSVDASAGAGPSATPSAAPTSAAPTSRPPVAPVATLDGVSVTGALGKDPAIAFKAPLAVKETMSKVIVAGQGAVVPKGGIVNVHYHGVNGYTGETFDNSWTKGQSIPFSLQQVVPGFTKGLEGKRVGDRVLIAMPGKDGYDASGGNPPKILVGDTLIFVVDIVDTQYDKPFGTATPVPAGLPTYAEKAGKPELTVTPSATPPAKAVVQPIVAGQGGHTIAAGDVVMTKYRMWSLKSGKLLEDRYDQPEAGKLSDTIECLKTALVGQKTGGRVMVVCPPPTGLEGSATPAVTTGEGLVFVIDLVFAAKMD